MLQKTAPEATKDELSNFNILLQELTPIAVFKGHEPAKQTALLASVGDALKSKIDMNHKQRLLSYLEVLRGIRTDLDQQIQAIRDDWDTPPF